jgi:hypothetical protein
MAHSDATTADQYLAEMPADRRATVAEIRRTILDSLPDGYVETMQYGMLTYVVPLETFADTYNGQPLGVISLANQKNHIAVYLMGVYGDDAERDWFVQAWKATGIRLDMGKSCVRVRDRDGVAFDVLGEAVRRVPPDRLIAAHDAAHGR